MISGFENYNDEIQILIERVMKYRVTLEVCVEEDCNSLIKIGEELKDDKLLTFGIYYLGEYYYYKSEYDKTVECCEASLKHGKKAGMYDLVSRSYNVLGILYRYRENYAYSVESYLKAAEYAKRANRYYELAMIIGNIAMLYIEIKDYEVALAYCKEAMGYYEQAEENEFYYFNVCIVLQSITEIHMQKGEYEEAEKYLNRMLDLITIAEQRERRVDKTPIYMLASVYYNKIDDVAKRDEYIEMSIRELKVEKQVLEIYGSVLEFAGLLVDCEKYDKFLDIISCYDAYDIEDMRDCIMEVQRVKMRYYMKMNNNEEYVKCSEIFLQCYDEKIKSHNKDIKHIIDLRRNLNNTMEENDEIKEYSEKLKQKAETDELTGLANRAGFNNYSERMFEKAYNEKMLYGVALIDVDFFKQYNDRYGHLKGDECLKTVSAILLEEHNENVFPARYGGDEFVIVFTNLNQKEIRDIIKRIKTKVAEAAILNEDSKVDKYVTLSQGAFVRVPNGQNKLWDFMSKADDVLYRVKKFGKNSYRVVDDFKKN